VTETTASECVVLDSSIWLEYLTDDAKADSFAPYLEGSLTVLIPTIVLYEVRKVLLTREGKTSADAFYSEALRRTIVSFDEVLALKAAEFSVIHKLSMADAIIYATAMHHGAQLITSDSHFANVPGVTLL
jgi:predicted nucleic acid-binding protein